MRWSRRALTLRVSWISRSIASQLVAEPTRSPTFSAVGKQYGRDARSDFRRSGVLTTVAVLTNLAGLGLSVWRVLEDEVAQAITIAGLALGVSLPIWWQADRYRRSGMENRRLQRHLRTVTPLLDSFEGPARTGTSLAIAQRLFSRPYEDGDPLREPVWPSMADLPFAAAPPTTGAVDTDVPTRESGQLEAQELEHMRAQEVDDHDSTVPQATSDAPSA